jgi:hypothetical protein
MKYCHENYYNNLQMAASDIRENIPKESMLLYMRYVFTTVFKELVLIYVLSAKNEEISYDIDP